MITLLRNPVVLTILATLAFVVGALLYIKSYGNDRYNAGVADQRAEQARNVAKQTDDLSTNLVKAQKEALAKLQGELDLARANLVAAGDRTATLEQTIIGLQNVPETNCVSVDPKSVRLLNAAACAYNSQYGFSGSDTSGGVCTGTTTSRASSSSVSGATGGNVPKN